jgi:hypothetical protein
LAEISKIAGPDARPKICFAYTGRHHSDNRYEAKRKINLNCNTIEKAPSGVFFCLLNLRLFHRFLLIRLDLFTDPVQYPSVLRQTLNAWIRWKINGEKYLEIN